MSRIIGVLLLATLLRLPSSAQEPLVQSDVRVSRSPIGCPILIAASAAAASLQIPLGIEGLPACVGRPTRRDSAETISLQGLTRSEVFNRLMQVDGRFRWAEDRGVIVVRPSQEWTSTDGFLQRHLPSFAVRDATLDDALTALFSALGPWRFGDGPPPASSTTPQSGIRFSVELENPRVVDVLNSIVRSHGSSTWSVSYCKAPARYEHATIGFTTHDRGGFSRRSVFLTDENGRRYDPCSGWRGARPAGPR